MKELKLLFRSLKDVVAATNFVGEIDLRSTPCSSRDIRQGGAAGTQQQGYCYAGRRQTKVT